MTIHENRLVFLESSPRYQTVERANRVGAPKSPEVYHDNPEVEGLVRGVHDSINSHEIAHRNGYDSVGKFQDGVAIARMGEVVFVVNEKGERVDKKSYADANEAFSEGKIAVKEGSKWHYVDRAGRDLKFGEFDEAYPFSQGVAGVRAGAFWRFLKADGSRLNERAYSMVEDFEGGVAHAKRGRIWYVVDIKGNEQVAQKERVEE